MKAIKAIYQNGKVKLTEKPEEPGPVEVVVVFPESDGDARWEEILAEKTPRKSFVKYVEKVKEQIRQGKTKPLNLRDL